MVASGGDEYMQGACLMQHKANTCHRSGHSDNTHIHRPHDTKEDVALSGNLTDLQAIAKSVLAPTCKLHKCK